MRRILPALLIVGGLALGACGDDDDESSATQPPSATEPAATEPAASEAPAGVSSAADCAAGNTITDGVLTIATGEPAFPPYVINDATPEDGQGFEAAVAMAVARELGFEGDAVTWVRTALRRRRRTRPEGLRLQPPAVHDHARAGRGRRLQPGLLHGTAGDLRPRRLPGRLGADAGRPAGPQDRGRRRHHQRHVRRRGHRTRAGPADLQRQRRRQAGAREQPDRCHRQRPADGVVHHRRRDRGHHGVRSDRRERYRRVRPAARQGQPAHRVRRHRPADVEGLGRARHDHHHLDERVHRGTGHLAPVAVRPGRHRGERCRPGPASPGAGRTIRWRRCSTRRRR